MAESSRPIPPAPSRSVSVLIPARLGRRTYFPLGLGLLTAVVLGYATGLKPPGWSAVTLLPDRSLLTGLGMGLYLLAMLAMPALRARRRAPVRTSIRVHKLLGALGPAVLFLHAESLGYGYLKVLSLAFIAVMLLGLMNHETLGLKGRMPAFVWMIAHVALSTVLCTLAVVHAYFALLYE